MSGQSDNLVADDLSAEDLARLEESSRGFGVLKFRNYRLFFVGQFVSTTGGWMQSLAQSWLVVETLDASPFQLGLVPIFQFGPSLIFGIPAGTLVDRFSRRYLLVATQILYMLLALVLAFLTWTGQIQLWHVYATGFIFGITSAVDMPARHAFVSELVPRYALKNAIAINAATFNMGRILGPAVAGVILAWVGPAWCFLLNGVSYIGPIAAMFMMQLLPFVKSTAGSGWAQIKEGLAYIRAHDDIRRPMLLVLVVGSFGMVYTVWIPLIATESFHTSEGMFGVMFSSMGLGSLLGALSVAYMRTGKGRTRMIITGILQGAATLSIGLIAVVPLSPWIATIAITWSGICAANTMSLANAIVQTSAPDELRGRVMAVYSTVFTGTLPIGGLLAGTISNRWNVETSMIFGGGVVVIAATTMFVRHLMSQRQEDNDPAPIPVG
ncbi:MAG: MFS transporter [Thermomicrobiales bacterium]|nr:MFS transporter [Thermomicrobiales bacterium]